MYTYIIIFIYIYICIYKILSHIGLSNMYSILSRARSLVRERERVRESARVCVRVRARALSQSLSFSLSPPPSPPLPLSPSLLALSLSLPLSLSPSLPLSLSPSLPLSLFLPLFLPLALSPSLSALDPKKHTHLTCTEQIFSQNSSSECMYDRFHWECYTLETHKIEKIKLLGTTYNKIPRNLSLGGFRGCSIFSGNCHIWSQNEFLPSQNVCTSSQNVCIPLRKLEMSSECRRRMYVTHCNTLQHTRKLSHPKCPQNVFVECT